MEEGERDRQIPLTLSWGCGVDGGAAKGCSGWGEEGSGEDKH